MDDKAFGAKLKSLRLSAGKTVPESSAYLISLGYRASEKTIYGWERGHSQPTPDTFLDLCKFYEVKDILGAFGYRKSPNATKAASGEEPTQMMLAPDEQQLVTDYRSLNPQGQALVRQNIEVVVLSDKYKKSHDLSDMDKEA